MHVLELFNPIFVLIMAFAWMVEFAQQWSLLESIAWWLSIFCFLYSFWTLARALGMMVGQLLDGRRIGKLQLMLNFAAFCIAYYPIGYYEAFPILGVTAHGVASAAFSAWAAKIGTHSGRSHGPPNASIRSDGT